jgi:hypothetical protein
MLDNFNSNQALQLLYVHEKESHKYDLSLTNVELRHIQLCLIDKWDELTTHYKKQLETKDKLDNIAKMSRGLPLFT